MFRFIVVMLAGLGASFTTSSGIAKYAPKYAVPFHTIAGFGITWVMVAFVVGALLTLRLTK